jgi:hypothetical protein
MQDHNDVQNLIFLLVQPV